VVWICRLGVPFDGCESVVRCDNFHGAWIATSHSLQRDGRSFLREPILQRWIVVRTLLAEKRFRLVVGTTLDGSCLACWLYTADLLSCLVLAVCQYYSYPILAFAPWIMFHTAVLMNCCQFLVCSCSILSRISTRTTSLRKPGNVQDEILPRIVVYCKVCVW